jgi:hypothetical protein
VLNSLSTVHSTRKGIIDKEESQRENGRRVEKGTNEKLKK